MTNPSLYFAIIVPFQDLFAPMTLQQVVETKFGMFTVQIARHQEGITLAELKQRLLKKWQQETEKNPSLRQALPIATEQLSQAVHAYLVLEDTATMLQTVRKGFQQHKAFDLQQFCYFQMLQAASAPGSFVQILTDGSVHWEQHSDERLNRCAKMISKDQMIFDRLSPKVLDFWTTMNEKAVTNQKKKK